MSEQFDAGAQSLPTQYTRRPLTRPSHTLPQTRRKLTTPGSARHAGREEASQGERDRFAGSRIPGRGRLAPIQEATTRDLDKETTLPRESPHAIIELIATTGTSSCVMRDTQPHLWWQNCGTQKTALTERTGRHPRRGDTHGTPATRSNRCYCGAHAHRGQAQATPHTPSIPPRKHPRIRTLPRRSAAAADGRRIEALRSFG